MSKTTNPLKGILDIYSKGVKDGDKKGFADLYKSATEAIFADAIEKSSKHINPCENCEFGYGKSWIDKDGIFHLETCKEKQDCIRMKEK